MPQKIETKLLYPAKFESLTPSVLKSLRTHVLPTLEVLPKKRPKTAKASVKRCPRLGIVCWGGNLDEAGWPESQADQDLLLSAAKKVDAVAVWFDHKTLMPPDKNGERKFLSEEFWRASDFHDLIDGLKHFIQGVEVALVRRVIIIGAVIHANVQKGNPLPGPTWIDVPKNRKPQEITRESLLSALGVTPNLTDIGITSLERKS